MRLHLSGLTKFSLFFTTTRATLLEAIGNASLGHIIGSHLYFDPVAQQDSDVVLAHLTRQIRKNFMVIFKLNPEHRTWKGFDDGSFDFYLIFRIHGDLSLIHQTACRK